MGKGNTQYMGRRTHNIRNVTIRRRNHNIWEDEHTTYVSTNIRRHTKIHVHFSRTRNKIYGNTNINGEASMQGNPNIYGNTNIHGNTDRHGKKSFHEGRTTKRKNFLLNRRHSVSLSGVLVTLCAADGERHDSTSGSSIPRAAARLGVSTWRGTMTRRTRYSVLVLHRPPCRFLRISVEIMSVSVVTWLIPLGGGLAWSSSHRRHAHSTRKWSAVAAYDCSVITRYLGQKHAPGYVAGVREYLT